MFKANILIIDDNQSICRGCEMILKSLGHTTTVCQTGTEGSVCLQEKEYDLILLDIRLPDYDGMNLLSLIHQDYPDLHIVMMTGFSSVEQTVQAMKKGAFDYLSKPFTDDALTLSVNKALESAQLRRDNLHLRKQLFQRFEFTNIVGDSPAILRVFDSIKKVAPTDTTVLLNGESGTGKELLPVLYTPTAEDRHSPLSQSIAVHFLQACLKVSFLVMSKERSQEQRKIKKAFLKLRMVVHYFLMKLPILT